MREQIAVYLNSIQLKDDEWHITSGNELQLTVFVGVGDEVRLYNNGSNYIKFAADGTTNRWKLGVDIEHMRFRSFCDTVFEHRNNPTVADLISQLRTTIGLVD